MDYKESVRDLADALRVKFELLDSDTGTAGASWQRRAGFIADRVMQAVL